MLQDAARFNAENSPTEAKNSHTRSWCALPRLAIFSDLLFVLDRMGALGGLTRALEPVVVGLLGLPRDVAQVLVMGFLRRDYGAAGMFVLAEQRRLTGVQAVVVLTVMTLFLPCIANFLMIVKERGPKVALRCWASSHRSR